MDAADALGKAYDDYFAVSDVLMTDLTALVDQPLQSGVERRNFLRGAWGLIEGDTESLRRIAASIAEASGKALTSKQQKLIADERSLDSLDRIKESLKLAYAVFALPNAPNFGGPEWGWVITASTRRDRVTHPKTVADLEISEQEWSDCFKAFTWLNGLFRDFHSAIHRTYASGES